MNNFEWAAINWWQIGNEDNCYEQWRNIAHYCTGGAFADTENMSEWLFLNEIAWERARATYAKAA